MDLEVQTTWQADLFRGRRRTWWTLKCRFRGSGSTLMDLEVQVSWQWQYFDGP